MLNAWPNLSMSPVQNKGTSAIAAAFISNQLFVNFCHFYHFSPALLDSIKISYKNMKTAWLAIDHDPENSFANKSTVYISVKGPGRGERRDFPIKTGVLVENFDIFYIHEEVPILKQHIKVLWYFSRLNTWKVLQKILLCTFWSLT